MVGRSLIGKVYLHVAITLLTLGLVGLGAGHWLFAQGRLDALRQLGRDHAQLVAAELERGASATGPSPRQLATVSQALHVRLVFHPWAERGSYPQALLTTKETFAPGLLPGGSWRHYWVRLDRAHRPLGALEVEFGPAEAAFESNHLWGIAIWLLLLALLLVPPLYWWVLRPLGAMVAVADRLGAGDLATPVAITRRDEFGELERAFESLRARVALTLAQKEKLLADISHELRGPLSRMAIAVPLLHTSPEDAPTVTLLEREIVLMDELIGELLALARAQSPDALELTPVDLATLAQDLTASRDLARQSAGLTLEITLEAAPMNGDARLLLRALGNLLDNALKYTPSGGTVRMQTGREGAMSFFRVSDDGPGVPPEALAQLFEPFYRADTSRSRETGGTGLGLAIVRAIAQSHGGTATLMAPSGHGTTAELRFPGL